jgi:hypothetical protein
MLKLNIDNIGDREDHGIRFKLFNPSERLKLVSSLVEFDIPTLDEMMTLLGQADRQYAIAA